MEGVKIAPNALTALSKLTPELLLLGLQLLSKNVAASVPPCAVVQPRPQTKATGSNSPSSPPLKPPVKSPQQQTSSSPSSPSDVQHQQVPQSTQAAAVQGRKRKRGETEELSDNEKREKR